MGFEKHGYYVTQTPEGWVAIEYEHPQYFGPKENLREHHLKVGDEIEFHGETGEYASLVVGTIQKVRPDGYIVKTTPAGKKVFVSDSDVTKVLSEKSPPKWEKTVKAMKKHKDITNPWALSWWMKGKGYKSHKK